MIFDLLDSSSFDAINVHSDICIIGAGTSGLYLASLLSKTSLNVAIIESGSEIHSPPDSDFHSICQKSVNYLGAEKGRSFGLGGTSRLWGGQMIPLSETDSYNRDFAGFSKWPISYSEVVNYFPAVYSRVGINPLVADSNYFSDLLSQNPLNKFSSYFSLRYSSWIPFKLRNFNSAFGEIVSSSKRVNLWSNAHYIRSSIIKQSPLSSVSSIFCQSKEGHSLSISAKYFIFCSGALESTRFVLDLNNSLSEDINEKGSVGHYFQDHLSASVASINCLNWSDYTRYISPKFLAGTLHTPRIDTRFSFQESFNLTSSFVHFLFDIPSGSGFDLVKNFLRAKQGSSNFDFTSSSYYDAAKDIISLASSRVFNKSLYIPKNATLTLQVDVEQFPSYDNSVSIDYKNTDSFGRPTIVLDWSISDHDYHHISTVQSSFISYWNLLPSLSSIASLSPIDRIETASVYDVYHPTGSLRMGASSSNSSVDINLRLWHFSNVFVCSTAVMPSPGSANPGLTHLSLAHRLNDHLVALCTQ